MKQVRNIRINKMDGKSILLFSLIILIITSCRKDIKMPSTEMEKIYGEWEWVKTYGGWGGSESTPSSTGTTASIEFDRKGNYKNFVNGKLELKLRYSITERYSSFNQTTGLYISYKHNKLFNHSEYGSDQGVGFGGQDSLFIADEGNDGSGYIYIRKK